MTPQGHQDEAPGRITRLGRTVACVLAAAVALVLCLAAAGDVRAQGLGSGDFALPKADPDARLLLEADELIYDFDNDVVTARGNVLLRYDGYILYANAVTLDRAAAEFRAVGGARLEEPDGNIIVAQEIRLSEDFRDGFIAGLRLDTIQRTRFAASSAERIDGDVTVFHNGVYTACHSCLTRPDRPPTWQIKARRIVYDKRERSIRYEAPRIEFWGVPVAYLPYLSHPDPTISRKSGFLIPTVVYSNLLGAGVRVPYFQTLGPSRDITFALTPLTRQGVLADVEYRQQLINGAYAIRGAGILQANPDVFGTTSGNRRFRGAVSSAGEFAINQWWRWGWSTIVPSDRSFLKDYKQDSGVDDTAISTLYLNGLGETNFFDIRGYGFNVLQENFTSDAVLDPPAPFSPFGSDLQDKQPIVHPSFDYDGVLDSSVVGGELAYHLNVTSLSRFETDAFGASNNGVLEARFPGVEGTFTRTTGVASWRRQFIDPFGQVFTPTIGVQADAFALNNRDPDVTAIEDGAFGRATPWAGIEYRWPWLITLPVATQTIEPIAQIIARPNEGFIGRLPNEDSQSVALDDTNLFARSKFSGFDRVEGGTRANVGVRYTLQSFYGGFVSALFGQSFQLAGENSYAIPDILDSAAGSGLTGNESDYVASLYLDTNGGLQIAAQTLFDQDTFNISRAEVRASGKTGPISVVATYAFLDEEPALGILEDQQEIQGGASLKLMDRLRLFGQIRYDIESDEVIREGVGIGYDDDSLSASLAYSVDFTGDEGDPVDRTVFLRLGLRTLGDASFSSGLEN